MTKKDEDVRMSFVVKRSLRDELHKVAKSEDVTVTYLLRQFAKRVVSKGVTKDK